MPAEAAIGESLALVRYPVTAAEIEAKRAEYAALTCDTRDGYEAVRLAIGHCRATRVQIEARRKELKADSLEYGRRVDSVAKELTALIASMEEPLALKKAAVDEEKSRQKAEAEAAEKRAIEEKVRAERAAEEAQLRVAREAEEARLRAEQERLAAERAAFADEQRKAQEAIRIAREAEEARLSEERRRLAVDREQVEAQRRAAEAEERQRRLDAEAAARSERERIAAEERLVAEAERQAALQHRLDALRPDAEKVWAFAATLRGLATPNVQSESARSLLRGVAEHLGGMADQLERFGKESDGQHVPARPGIREGVE